MKVYIKYSGTHTPFGKKVETHKWYVSFLMITIITPYIQVGQTPLSPRSNISLNSALIWLKYSHMYSIKCILQFPGIFLWIVHSIDVVAISKLTNVSQWYAVNHLHSAQQQPPKPGGVQSVTVMWQGWLQCDRSEGFHSLNHRDKQMNNGSSRSCMIAMTMQICRVQQELEG